jgi:hypothetical protein
MGWRQSTRLNSYEGKSNTISRFSSASSAFRSIIDHQPITTWPDKSPPTDLTPASPDLRRGTAEDGQRIRVNGEDVSGTFPLDIFAAKIDAPGNQVNHRPASLV